jgi:metallopeptidase MepB
MLSSYIINWNSSSDEIINETTKIIEKSKKTYEIIIKLNFQNKDHFNAFIPLLSDNLAEITTFQSMCSFINYTSSNKKIVDICEISNKLLNDHTFVLNNDENIYAKIMNYYILKKHKKSEILFLEKIINYYRKNGFHLDKNGRNSIHLIKIDISECENKIKENILHTESNVFSKPLLIKGIHTPFGVLYLKDIPIDIFKQNKFELTNSIYEYLMCNISCSNTRHKIEYIYNTQCENNIPIFIKLLILRYKYSRLLSYNNYSELKLNDTFAKDNLLNFIKNITSNTDKRYEKELILLHELQNNSNGNKLQNNISNISLNSWDMAFLFNQIKKKYQQDVHHYFPHNHVIKYILEIFSAFFKLKFINKTSKNIWNDKVQYYEVIDLNNKNEIIGYFYLDSLNNPKINKSLCLCIHSSCKYPYNSNKYQLASVVLFYKMIYNNNDGSFFSFDEVINLFHEFEKAIRFLCGKSDFCIFSGFSLESDFTEITSHIIELLFSQPHIIKKISSHYLTHEPLSDIIINNLTTLNHIDIGYQCKKYCITLIYDQIIHSSNDFIKLCVNTHNTNNINDINLLIKNLYKQIYNECMTLSEFATINYNSDYCTASIPIDVINGNECFYYKKLWNYIFAYDIINNFPYDKNAYGVHFRKCFYEFGTINTGKDILHLFNNRGISTKSFFNKINYFNKNKQYLEFSIHNKQNKQNNKNKQNKQNDKKKETPCDNDSTDNFLIIESEINKDNEYSSFSDSFMENNFKEIKKNIFLKKK